MEPESEQAIEDNEKDEVMIKLRKCSQLKRDKILEETFGKKKYLESMSLVESREMFRIRNKTMKTRMKMKSNENFFRELLKCHECHNIDTQLHLLWCPAYAHLREGKDINKDRDLVTYFREVFKAREDNI